MADIFYYFILFIVVVVLAFCVIVLIQIIAAEIYHATLRYDLPFSDTAIVLRKDYVAPYMTTTYMTVGKTSVPQFQHHAEQFNVHVLYEGEKYCIDDEDFFNRVDVKDKTSVVVHKGYNKHNELKNVYLTYH